MDITIVTTCAACKKENKQTLTEVNPGYLSVELPKGWVWDSVNERAICLECFSKIDLGGVWMA